VVGGEQHFDSTTCSNRAVYQDDQHNKQLAAIPVAVFTAKNKADADDTAVSADGSVFALAD
jgi:hypothetical protein